MRDWNAKVWNVNKDSGEVVGRYSYGYKNERDELLIEFADKYNPS